MNEHPLEILIEQYLSEKDITSGTLDLLTLLFKQWIRYLKENQIMYPTEQDIEKYLSWKRSFKSFSIILNVENINTTGLNMKLNNTNK